MANFDEAWLKDYQRRRTEQAQSSAPIKWPDKPPQPAAHNPIESTATKHPDIVFRLSKPLLLANRKKNMHWAAKSDAIHKLANEAAQAITNPPPAPLSRAFVSILRYSVREPDWDNLQECQKFLLDILQPRSKRHPYGLGIIAGDDPVHLKSEIQHVQVKSRAEQQTLVRIVDIS
jgi:hypothetical protein